MEGTTSEPHPRPPPPEGLPDLSNPLLTLRHLHHTTVKLLPLVTLPPPNAESLLQISLTGHHKAWGQKACFLLPDLPQSGGAKAGPYSTSHMGTRGPGNRWKGPAPQPPTPNPREQSLQQSQDEAHWVASQEPL